MATDLQERPEAKVGLSARISPNLKAALDDAARKDRRPLSQFVELVLEDAIAARKGSPSA